VLTQLAEMQPAAPLLASYPAAKSNHVAKGGKPKAMSTPKLAMPTFDDEEDTVVIRRDTNADSNITANFLDAAFGFQERKDI
jgi:hypothetical protein